MSDVCIVEVPPILPAHTKKKTLPMHSSYFSDISPYIQGYMQCLCMPKVINQALYFPVAAVNIVNNELCSSLIVATAGQVRQHPPT